MQERIHHVPQPVAEGSRGDLGGHLGAWKGGVQSPDERRRAARLRDPGAFRRFVVCRSLLRWLLGQYLRTAPASLVLGAGPHGKPFVRRQPPGDPALEFNLSHSHELAVLVFSRDRPLGVDVEYIRPVRIRALARAILSHEEFERFEALPESVKLLAFFHCWTRKEACLKAVGDELTAGIRRFRVTFLPDEPPALLAAGAGTGEPAAWTLESLSPAPGYVAVMASPGRLGRLRCYDAGPIMRRLAAPEPLANWP